jgi:hypothetical protein
MMMTAIEAATKKVVERMWRQSDGRRIGIRELALAVEEEVGEATLDQIHAAVLKVAVFYPSDDPQDQEAERQRSFAWHGGEKDPMSWRVWVCKKG